MTAEGMRFRRLVLKQAGNAILLGLLLAGATSALGAGKTPLVGYGWEFLAVNTEDVWRNRAKFAATGLDGVILPVDGKRADGSLVMGRDLLNGTIWKPEDFARTPGLLRDITASRGLADSYGLMYWMPKTRIRWTDDEAWRGIAGNVRILARAAKEGGLWGLVIDHEDYHKARQFFHSQGDSDYAATAALARRRAREVFVGLFEEFPDAKVLSFWFLSECRSCGDCGDIAGVAEGNGRLWHHFVNGILDALPPTARLVDGCETAYTKTGEGFRSLAWSVKTGSLPLVAPENREKYARQMKVGFGQYVDAYIITNSADMFYLGPRCGSRQNAFAINLMDAKAVAEDVIWLYGEHGTWIDWDRKDSPKLQYPVWETLLPGLSAKLRLVGGDLSSLENAANNGRMANLIANSGCAASPGAAATGVPEPYACYPGIKQVPPGVFARDPDDGATDPGCLKLSGEGCFTVFAKGLTCGQVVYVRVKAKGVRPIINAAWRHGGGWKWDLGNNYVAGREAASPSEWRSLTAFLIVPKGADGIGLTLGGPSTSDSPTRFDDVCVFAANGRGKENDR